MSWVTAVWSMLLGATIALCLPYLFVGIWQRSAAHLFFVLTALAVIGMEICELNMIHCRSAGQYARAQQWSQLPIVVLFVGLVGFIRSYFRTGRLWLGLAACLGFSVGGIITLASPPSINFQAITGVRLVRFLGETVAAPAGVFSRWTWLGEFSILLLLGYVVDAAVSLWRNGDAEERRRAVLIGGSTAFFIAVAAVLGGLTHRQMIALPYMSSFPFAAILVAMAYELGSDLFRVGRFRAAQFAMEAALVESEDRIRQAEQRIALAAEAAHLGVWELNSQTGELWVSDKGRELLGIAPEVAITSEAFHARVHPEDRAAREAAMRQAIETMGSYETEFRVVLPDGTIRWLAGRARCIPNAHGEGSRLLGVSMDVTKRRQAEDLFRLSTEANPSGTVLVDQHGCIVLVNAHVEELFGYPREELLGQPVEILVPERLQAAHPRHREGFVAAPETRAMGAGRELFARRRDGSEFPIEIGLNPIETPQGPLVLASVVDISARKAAEAEARQRREQVNLLNRAGLLGEMTASLAHELNQPLTAIVNNAFGALQYLEQDRLDARKLREILEDVFADGRRATEIMQNVRSAIKKGTAIRGPVNLNDVVTSVAHMVYPDAAASGCRVETALAKELPLVHGDPTQLQQVLINLIHNAFEAMQETPPERRAVEIATSTDGTGTVEVAVRDYGGGIATSTQERLFEQFFTTKDEGLGMGLAIVRSIVEAHDGTIAAENVDGAGARFYLQLPAAKPAAT